MFCFKEKTQNDQRIYICDLQKSVDDLKKTIIVQDFKLSEKESRLLILEQEIEVLGQIVSSLLDQTTGKIKVMKNSGKKEATLNEDEMKKDEKKFKCSKCKK